VSGGGVRDEDMPDRLDELCVCERKETAGGAHFQNSHPHNKLAR
jgi:hypothetical protein